MDWMTVVLFLATSILAWPIQPSIQWIPWAIYLAAKWLNIKLVGYCRLSLLSKSQLQQAHLSQYLFCLVCTSSVLVTCCGGGEAAAIVSPPVAGYIHSGPAKSTLLVQRTERSGQTKKLNSSARAQWGAGYDGHGKAAWSWAVESRAECAALLHAERRVLSQMQSADHENWALHAECWPTKELTKGIGLFSHSWVLKHRWPH